MEDSGALTPAQRIRQESRESARRALLAAGLAETIARGGLEDPSIEAICARAGYTRGAFYFHFRDRDHFDAEMFEWVLKDILTSLWASAIGEATDIREIVKRFNRTMAARDWPDLHGDIRAGYLAVLRNIVGGATEVRERHAKLMANVIDMLAEGIRFEQKNDAVRTDIDPHNTAALLVLSAIGSIVWDNMGLDLDMPAIGETLITFLQRPPSA